MDLNDNQEEEKRTNIKRFLSAFFARINNSKSVKCICWDKVKLRKK